MPFGCDPQMKELAVTLLIVKKSVTMIRKFHNHTLQTNPRHREEVCCYMSCVYQCFMTLPFVQLLRCNLPVTMVQ